MLMEFPAKVLLLGEYTILNGSKALALPFFDFKGTWSFSKTDSLESKKSQESLKNFISSSHSRLLDLARFSDDLENGLWFDSNIPQGYGLGSSGAVVAALFSRYGSPNDNILENKNSLAQLENAFHGASSGIDPLVSHIQNPLLIHHFEDVEVLQKRPYLSGFFLLNTGYPRQTGPLVKIYQEKLKDPHFKKGCAEILACEVNFAIQSVITGSKENLFHHLWHISKFQWDYFQEMIPVDQHKLWTKGLDSGDYILKLCGAGGGGFILGFSDKSSPHDLSQNLFHKELRELR
jgi:mevalonate kinase